MFHPRESVAIKNLDSATDGRGWEAVHSGSVTHGKLAIPHRMEAEKAATPTHSRGLMFSCLKSLYETGLREPWEFHPCSIRVNPWLFNNFLATDGHR